MIYIFSYSMSMICKSCFSINGFYTIVEHFESSKIFQTESPFTIVVKKIPQGQCKNSDLTRKYPNFG